MKLSQNAKHAIMIGSLCSISYFSIYIVKNILSAVTPQIVEAGYTEAYIGSISSLYFIFYAFGQLLNGVIGDKIKARYMISVGLMGAAITNFIFVKTIDCEIVAMIVYALTGFSLSMIYAPMTKVVSENTEPIYATRCSLGYTFASFFGSPTAGLLASFLAWESVFHVSSATLAFMSIFCFIFFLAFEKKGLIHYGQYQKKSRGIGRIGVLIKHRIIKFSLISILTGIVRTSVVFWLPTYISQFLGFTSSQSAGIFTVATLVISLTTFIAIFIYERLGRNMDKTILLMFSSAVMFFALTYFTKTPVPNIIFIVLAIMASNGASSMLFSRYCPSLYETGMVSAATGFIEFVSYMAAAAANLIFANAVNVIGWQNLILIWLSLMLLGVIISLPYDRLRKKQTNT